MKRSRFREDQIIGVLKEDLAAIPERSCAASMGSLRRPSTIGAGAMAAWGVGRAAAECQSARKTDPGSASNFDPFERRVLAVALASSELAGIAETWRARVV